MNPLPPLPAINATLNGMAVAMLCAGYVAIRRGNRAAHRAFMLAAAAISIVFLACYLVHHAQHGSTRFTGLGWSRPVYFSVLLSHTVLAAAAALLVPMTLRRALLGQEERHRTLARWVLPLWLYVSVTGVGIYWMLYHGFGQG